ncbi:UxaA family hydrolase, partial [Arthrobacter sp. ZGTC212]|uniref:UxaA family hydrolase n=1 Tax=Arthrobacter sp. ZGTC212 TaxID=2058899 RepID=UPI001C670490
MAKDDEIYMYGVLIGKVNCDLDKGALISTLNLRHAANDFKLSKRNTAWKKPDVTIFKDRTFSGFHRSNGTVGTANYWLVIPLVFCENRNVLTLKTAFEEKLGYKIKANDYSSEVEELIRLYQSGADVSQIIAKDLTATIGNASDQRLFENVDG